VRTERVTVASLLFDPANVRKHGERNLDAIKASLARFGQQKPIVVDGDGIVRAGNGTLMAAKALGWHEIEIVRTNLRGSEATAYAIADNRTAELAEWDEGALAEQLAALQIDDEALAAATGFDASEIERMALPVDVVEDEVPEVPVDPITKPGNLWLLDEHRVLCGDSTKAEDVARLMAGAKADACVTDPPYNINYGNIKHHKFKSREIANDNMSAQDFRAFCERFAVGIASHCAGCVYCFGPPGADGRIMFAVLDGLFHCSTTIVWNKDQFTLGRGKYQNKYEPCWFGWVEDGSRFQDDRTRTNVWDFARPKASIEHPTMKPVSLIAECVSHSSPKGSLIYDPFLGSGTTLIAAEQLGRKCYGIEINPDYCDVIVKRWETLTGKKATLAS